MFRFREFINLRLYPNKAVVLNSLRIISFLAALSAIVIIAYYVGFPQTERSALILVNIIKGILGFFVLNYLVRLLYSFNVPQHIRSTWPEGLLILVLIYDGVSYFLFGIPIIKFLLVKVGIENFGHYFVLFVQVYMLLIAGLEIVKGNEFLARLKLKPSWSLILSLFVLLMAGTFLLMMPNMTTQPGSMRFLDALFTSVSAISQTGLIVEDTGTFFTFKGHLTLMFLIQVGALGIISFGTFFGAYLTGGGGLRQQRGFHDFFFASSEIDTTSLFRKIISYTIIIDVAGTIALYFLWDDAIEFASFGDKLFHSLFHSVSAFCTAGFSLFDKSLYTEGLRHSYLLHIGFMTLVFLGSIGYPTLIDLFSLRNIRDRLAKPWKQWNINTRISLYTSVGVAVFGALVFFGMEYGNTLKDMSLGASTVTSFFQSISRTSGFNTVDMSIVGTPMLVVFCFLMFVGGSSGSVCGGIRTSTFAISLISVLSALRGKRSVEIGKRRIADTVIYRVITIIFFAFCYIVVGVFVLSIVEPEMDVIRLLFEMVSAYCTVGLTTGITKDLSDAGRVVIIVSMFVGRVGTLTLAFALSSQMTRAEYKYPKTNIMLG